MPVRLTAYLRSGALERKTFGDGAFTIGRSARASLCLDDPRVSREHAKLIGEGGVWRLEDLASKNGTRINGRATASAPIPGDAWLSIGGVPVRFERMDVPASPRADPGLADAAIDALLDGCLDAVRDISGRQRASLWSRWDGEYELVLRRGDNFPRERMDLIRDVGARGALRIANDFAGPKEAGAIVCLPVFVDAFVAGVIYADGAAPVRACSSFDIELLRGLAEQAAIGLAARRRAG